MNDERPRLLLGALVLALLGAFVAARWSVTTDISHFFPGGEPHSDVMLARQLASGPLSRGMVLLVRASDSSSAVAAGRALEREIRADPDLSDALEFVDGGPPQGVEEALWTLYHPRRLGFLAERPEDVPATIDDAGVARAIDELKRRLELPLSSLVSRVAPSDPFLVLPRLFERMAGSRSERLQIVDGRFVTDDGRASVLFTSSKAPSFDTVAQRPIVDGLHAAFARVVAASDGPLELLMSGANRFALRAEASIRADITRVSIGSMIGLALLFLGLFRSLRLVLLTLPVVAAGFLSGMGACLALFGQVHGLTLAFGAALIGVSIDYPVHLHCHHVLAGDAAGPRATLRRIRPGLLLGAATTVVGYLALLVSTFPGLRELAVFGAFGIGAALLATDVFLPGLMRLGAHGTSAPPPSLRRAADTVGRGLSALDRHRRWLPLPLLATLALIVVGLPRARWNDDISDLNRLDPALLAEDEAVRAEIAAYEQGRLVVAVGADREAAWECNDRVLDALERARDAGELDGFRNPGTLLPSAARQRAVAAAVRADPTLWPRLRDALGRAGFVAEAFTPFAETLAAPPADPLVFGDLIASPMAGLLRPFEVPLDGGVAVVSLMAGLHDEAALAARLAAIDGAHLVDLRGAFTAAYAAYRERMASLLLTGLLAVVALVALRHRAWRPTLAACGPALLGVFGTVAVLALLGIPLDMLSLVALLMVVSMGVDYGVFLVEVRDHPEALGATLLAVLVAGTSTILGFGLLASSDHPALFSIGAVSGLGVAWCLALAPTMRVLVRPRDDDGRDHGPPPA
ncbi:MAG: MMPL family transporter [Planctomycetes bacterium]|nr:MMPL family transporter [Planctomycetota bacterium]